MKVILTGATGFIGGEVLNQALAHPVITSILCITRRSLSESITSNPKVKVIILTDFTIYPPEVMSQLEGAESCIWALGSPARKSPDLQECKRIEIGYTLAAAEAFAKFLAPPLKARGKSFRFVYLSGMFANREPDKKLLFLQNSRTIKGTVENELLALQQKEDSKLEVTIVRPGGVLSKRTLVPSILVGVTLSIKIEELAAAMIDEAVGDTKGTRTLECEALRNKGRALLKAAR